MKSTPKYVFLNLLMMGALYVSAISFITLLFQYVNLLFPDQLDFYYRGILNTIRTSTAFLIVVFPVYLITAAILGRDFKKYPELREFKLRKWLVYLTLFIASVVIIGGLVSLVYNFLNGELTARFVFKVISVFAVAGSAFGYYLYDLKNKVSTSTNKKLAWISLIVLVVAIGYGFYLVGSPFQQRLARLDEERVQDLQVIQSEVINYWVNKSFLPVSLSNLEDDLRGFSAPVDPETGQDYLYNVKGPLTFELCAEFKTKSLFSGEQITAKPLIYPERPYPAENWEHEVGLRCFERTIDPDFYKPIR